MGCAYCHEGCPPGSHCFPPLRKAGLTEEKIRFTLNGGVQIMNFLNLSDEDKDAIVAFLKTQQ